MVFLQFAAVALLFQVVAVILLLVTGSWGHEVPGFLVAINPLYRWAAGRDLLLFSPALFQAFATAHKLAAATNVVVYAAVQWIGAGLVIDLVRQKASS